MGLKDREDRGMNSKGSRGSGKAWKTMTKNRKDRGRVRDGGKERAWTRMKDSTGRERMTREY